MAHTGASDSFNLQKLQQLLITSKIDAAILNTLYLISNLHRTCRLLLSSNKQMYEAVIWRCKETVVYTSFKTTKTNFNTYNTNIVSYLEFLYIKIIL